MLLYKWIITKTTFLISKSKTMLLRTDATTTSFSPVISESGCSVQEGAEPRLDITPLSPPNPPRAPSPARHSVPPRARRGHEVL